MALMLLVSPGAAVFAQDELPPPICGDLADEDCAILEAAQLAGFAVTSYTSDLLVSVSAESIPTVAFDVAGDMQVTGATVVDPELMQLMVEISTLARTDPEAYLEMVLDDPGFVIDFYRGIEFDLTFALSLSDGVREAIEADSDVVFPATVSVPVKLIDGMLYFNLVELTEFLDGAPPELEGWVGIDFIGLMEMQLEDASGMSDEMREEMMGGDFAAIMAAQMSLSDPEFLEQFVEVERVDDTEVEGQAAAVFESTFDLVEMISSPEFGDFLTGYVPLMLAQQEDGPSADEVAEMLPMAMMMAPMLFQDLSLTSTSVIGLEDNNTYQSTAVLSWDLSGLLQLAEMSGELPADFEVDGTPFVELVMDLGMGGFGDEVTLEAPEDVTIIPLADLMNEGGASID
jgi:hypothetical protein